MCQFLVHLSFHPDEYKIFMQPCFSLALPLVMGELQNFETMAFMGSLSTFLITWDDFNIFRENEQPIKI
jgi:hypothetical protein